MKWEENLFIYTVIKKNILRKDLKFESGQLFFKEVVY